MVRLRCQSTGGGGGVQRKLGTCRLFTSAIRSDNACIPTGNNTGAEQHKSLLKRKTLQPTEGS